MKNRDSLQPKGKVELFVTNGKPDIVRGDILRTDPVTGQTIYKSAKIDFSGLDMLHQEVVYNIILNQGKDRVIESLTTGFIRVVARMAIGDRGTIPSDSTVPKVPDSAATGLFNEVHRDDIDTISLDIGTPDKHEVEFIKTFSALEIPITSFSNQASPVVNEVGLIVADLLSGNPLPRPPVNAPDTPDADEEMFSIRTFKSVPFEAANEIAVTIRYTIFIE